VTIQTSYRNTPVSPAPSEVATEEWDDDPWSGYADTLELNAQEAAQDEFAAAQARLASRGQALDQALQQMPSSPVPMHFPHLQSQGVNVHAGRVFGAQPGYYAPKPVPVQTPVTRPSVQAPVAEASPVEEPLPYEIDAWGNPVLPEYAELDAFGNLFYRYS